MKIFQVNEESKLQRKGHNIRKVKTLIITIWKSRELKSGAGNC